MRADMFVNHDYRFDIKESEDSDSYYPFRLRVESGDYKEGLGIFFSDRETLERLYEELANALGLSQEWECMNCGMTWKSGEEYDYCESCGHEDLLVH